MRDSRERFGWTRRWAITPLAAQPIGRAAYSECGMGSGRQGPLLRANLQKQAGDVAVPVRHGDKRGAGIGPPDLSGTNQRFPGWEVHCSRRCDRTIANRFWPERGNRRATPGMNSGLSRSAALRASSKCRSPRTRGCGQSIRTATRCYTVASRERRSGWRRCWSLENFLPAAK